MGLPEFQPSKDLPSDQYVAFMADAKRIDAVTKATVEAASGMCVLKRSVVGAPQLQFVSCANAKFKLDGVAVPMLPPVGYKAYVQELINKDGNHYLGGRSTQKRNWSGRFV